NTEREYKERTRIAAILRHSPHLERLTSLDNICLAVSYSGEWAVTVDQENVVALRDTLTVQQHGDAIKPPFVPASGALSPDAQSRALLGGAVLFKVGTLPHHKEKDFLATEAGPVRPLVFSLDNSVLIPRHAKGTIKSWDRTGAEITPQKEI